MKAEYIEREAAIDKHCAICKDNALCYRSRESCPEVKAFNSMPAADVQPVVRGRWMPYSNKDCLYVCSVCLCMPRDRTRYCPRCGALMDKEANE